MNMVKYYPHGGCRTAYGSYGHPHSGRRYYKGHVRKGFLPKTDIIEDENNYYIMAEFPGISRDDIKISVVEENVLNISGEKKNKENDEQIINLRKERSFGKFKRSFQLPEDADVEKIEAKTKNGVLTLTIPRFEPVKPKEKDIEIN